jgi:hypothetical protein
VTSQQRAALMAANTTRLGRVEVRRALREQRITLAEAMQEPCAKPHLTRRVLDETIRAYEAHGTLRAAGTHLGITSFAVSLRLKKAGYTLPNNNKRRATMPRLKPEDMAERQIAQLTARRDQLVADLEAVGRDIAKWDLRVLRAVPGADDAPATIRQIARKLRIDPTLDKGATEDLRCTLGGLEHFEYIVVRRLDGDGPMAWWRTRKGDQAIEAAE